MDQHRRSNVNYRVKTLAKTLAAAIVISAGSAYAELPPGAYEQLLKQATEVYQVRLKLVQQTANQGPSMHGFLCEAQIVAVERSKSSRKPGDVVRFQSYYVLPEAWQRGFSGPKSPPLLHAGWTGRIYLKPGMKQGELELAAYGRSFVPFRIDATPPGSPSLDVQAVPSAQGGVEITSVNEKSLADKLGLRRGDRIVEINGVSVRQVEEVRPALARDKQRLAVSLVRDDEPIELTIRLAR
jgi:hypothetical protein